MRLPALACPCILQLSLLTCTPSLRRATADGPVSTFHVRICPAQWRRQPSQSASIRYTNLVLRHAHTSRAFDNGEPHLKSDRLKMQAFKLIYKNSAADRALRLIFVSRGSTYSAPRT